MCCMLLLCKTSPLELKQLKPGHRRQAAHLCRFPGPFVQVSCFSSCARQHQGGGGVAISPCTLFVFTFLVRRGGDLSIYSCKNVLTMMTFHQDPFYGRFAVRRPCLLAALIGPRHIFTRRLPFHTTKCLLLCFFNKALSMIMLPNMNKDDRRVTFAGIGVLLRTDCTAVTQCCCTLKCSFQSCNFCFAYHLRHANHTYVGSVALSSHKECRCNASS